MKQFKNFVLASMMLPIILLFQTTPVFAGTSSGTVSLSGPYDSDIVELTTTKEFSLYSYGDAEDVMFQTMVELSGLPSYSVSRKPSNFYSWYYDIDVEYTYILSDYTGSTYVNLADRYNFYYVTGPSFSVTCIATFTLTATSSLPEDFEGMLDVTLSYSPSLVSASSEHSIDYENSVALSNISEQITELSGVLGGEYVPDSEVTESKDAADTTIEDVGAAEQEYFDQYNEAYEDAGIDDFNLLQYGEEFSFVQELVNVVWNNMPDKLQYLFYAVLTLGVFALIVSAGGRIVKKIGN